jgi:hypothetical protein
MGFRFGDSFVCSLKRAALLFFGCLPGGDVNQETFEADYPITVQYGIG